MEKNATKHRVQIHRSRIAGPNNTRLFIFRGWCMTCQWSGEVHGAEFKAEADIEAHLEEHGLGETSLGKVQRSEITPEQSLHELRYAWEGLALDDEVPDRLGLAVIAVLDTHGLLSREES